jgi:GPH family glycoside/pentoside/hexuronide:cation symporter
MNRTARNLVYSLGNFANTLCQQVVGGQIRYFYVRRLGLEPGWYGALYAIFGLWNAVNDPLLGQLSDRTRTRWGRRVPYLIFGALPLGVAFFLLWTPPDPQTFGPLLTGLYLLAMLSLYDSIFTLMTVAYNSLFPELADDLKARSSLSSLREILAVIALLLAFILAPILRESVGFIAMGLIIGAITTLGYGASGFAVKERPIPASEPGVPLLTSLKETLSSVPFRWYLGANMMKEYVFLALPGTLPFWREFALKITGRGAGDQEAIMLGSAFVLTIPLLLVWQRITPRLGA